MSICATNTGWVDPAKPTLAEAFSSVQRLAPESDRAATTAFNLISEALQAGARAEMDQREALIINAPRKIAAPPPGCSKMLYTTPTGSCCSLSIRVDAPDDVMELARRLCKLLPDDVTAVAATFAATFGE